MCGMGGMGGVGVVWVWWVCATLCLYCRFDHWNETQPDGSGNCMAWSVELDMFWDDIRCGDFNGTFSHVAFVCEQDVRESGVIVSLVTLSCNKVILCVPQYLKRHHFCGFGLG